MNTNDRTFTLYMMTFPDKKVYIGITSQNLSRRFGYKGSAYKMQPVYEAIQKFGWDNIKKEVIEENLSVEEAKKKEQEYIELYQSKNGVYNKSKGGECGSLITAKFEVDGEVYDSHELAEMALAEGVDYHDITTRINQHGWSLEKALTKEKMKKNQKSGIQRQFVFV